MADVNINIEPSDAGMPNQVAMPQPTMMPPPPAEKISTIELKMRKTLGGDLMISDHADIDIVLKLDDGKVMIFPKEELNDIAYGAQDRLLKYLSRKGIVKPDSVQGGNVYGSMEAQMISSKEYNTVNLTIINISKWMDDERPYFEFGDKYEEMMTDRFADPEDEESTELGEVPHEETKGTLRPGYNYGPYWQSYTY
tara:strand:+ start:502 stop:1089 length:588 start_codon:yes stop_codon:yes gene_type:complete